MRKAVLAAVAVTVVVAVAVLAWVNHVAAVNYWLAVHTGTVNEPGPYYAFWSGFGSDLTKFGVIGAVVTAVCHWSGSSIAANRAAGGSATIPQPTANSTSASGITPTTRIAGPPES